MLSRAMGIALIVVPFNLPILPHDVVGGIYRHCERVGDWAGIVAPIRDRDVPIELLHLGIHSAMEANEITSQRLHDRLHWLIEYVYASSLEPDILQANVRNDCIAGLLYGWWD